MRDPAVPCREGKAAAGWEGAAGMPGTAPKLRLPAQAEQQTEFGSLRAAAFPEQGGNCPWNREGRDISLEVRFPWLQSQQGSTLPAGNWDEPLAPRSTSLSPLPQLRERFLPSALPKFQPGEKFPPGRPKLSQINHHHSQLKELCREDVPVHPGALGRTG